MIYESIEGWFNYAGFYDLMLAKFDNAVFVEIGAWKGMSIAYMAESIKNLHKDILFFAIDTFEGSKGDKYIEEDPDLQNGTLFEKYLNNIEPLKEFVTTIKGDSHVVHSQFPDESIDFLYIDGDHAYESIKKDILLWYPKIKNGGIISGHDFDNVHTGVEQAVRESFPVVQTWGSNNFVWYYQKP